MRITTNPQEPDFGSSMDITDEDPADDGTINTEIEGIPWAPVTPLSRTRPVCAFIDGVQRLDSRFYVEDGNRTEEAIAGSWAVGAAWSSLPPRIDSVLVGRSFIVAGGLESRDFKLPLTSGELTFKGFSVAESGADALVNGLHQQMRAAEGELCKRVEDVCENGFVVVDGPLHYATPAPVVGLIKRQSKRYLPADKTYLLRNLKAGQRTPLFFMKTVGLERYSWYTKISEGRSMDGHMVGLVRNEVASVVSLENARRLADWVAQSLPMFSSRFGSDPRAPQNLYPIGQLEKHLKRMLGDKALLRRHLDTYVHRSHQQAASIEKTNL